MHKLRRVLVWVLIFGAGLVLGPVLLALVAAVAAPAEDETRLMQAYVLLKAYDEHDPEEVLATLDTDGAIRDCGYTSEGLFGADLPRFAQGRAWTPYSGYFDLTRWRGDHFRRAVELLRTDHLRRNFSPFQLSFLNACVRRTVFAGLCARQVGHVLESGGARSPTAVPRGLARPDQRRETRTICTYLDGLAARRGQPLAGSGQGRPAPAP